jgi:hypothetical protein
MDRSQRAHGQHEVASWISTSARPQDSSRHGAAPRRCSALGIPALWLSARGLPTVGGLTPGADEREIGSGGPVKAARYKIREGQLGARYYRHSRRFALGTNTTQRQKDH